MWQRIPHDGTMNGETTVAVTCLTSYHGRGAARPPGRLVAGCQKIKDSGNIGLPTYMYDGAALATIRQRADLYRKTPNYTE